MANILNVHQRTLRIWDEKGILMSKRTVKNRRFYTIDDIEKGKFVLFLTRNLFVNINGIKVILGLLEGLEACNYIDCVNKIALKMDIDRKVQEENLKKSLKRGRKKIIERELE